MATTSVHEFSHDLISVVVDGVTYQVKILLDFGMDPGAQDLETGDSPLHISVRCVRTQCMCYVSFFNDVLVIPYSELTQHAVPHQRLPH